MRRDSHRLQVLDAIRTLSERYRRSPTFQQLGNAVGISAVAAWKNVQALVHDGKIVKTGPRYELAEDSDTLVLLSTDALRGELARRGVTMDALERPKLLWNEGRPCAANGCRERVGRGKLMCRAHWFRLPPAFRSDIMNAWAARNMQAYGEAVEAARDHLGGFTRVVERVG